ncbi:hypothetical protein [Nonomuraea roseoviolacea]|uniref:MFS transporter n=1 Tax=Nonomuraea roseoviolacea subsp. carminata TaxID=160689 RepID=A0ABT1KD69_9ACTN|nr:hypothetical protein [Nonomuraea roseoviolacea]MCP2351549.1 hypothetical protein [Nonomuraea roseoviolacea subsp. carminata]
MPHTRTDHRVDYGGAATLLLGLAPLLIVAEQGSGWGWTSPRTLALIGVGVAGLLGFVLVEGRMGDSALLPPRLFAGPLFTMSNAVNVVVGMGVFGGPGRRGTRGPSRRTPGPHVRHDTSRPTRCAESRPSCPAASTCVIWGFPTLIEGS